MKSSKLFLMALAAFALGAFALVGCEPAAEPAPEGGTTPAAGSETKATTPQTMTPPEEGEDAKTTEGGEATTTEGSTEKPADDGHGHAPGEEGH